jgi:hypothetical protein
MIVRFVPMRQIPCLRPGPTGPYLTQTGKAGRIYCNVFSIFGGNLAKLRKSKSLTRLSN